MYDARELTVEQIGQVLGVSRTTIYRALGSKAFAAAAAAEAAPSLAAPTPTPASTLTPVPVGHATKPVAPAAALKGSGVAAGQGQRGGTTHGTSGRSTVSRSTCQTGCSTPVAPAGVPSQGAAGPGRPRAPRPGRTWVS